jgi:hypothetical protein
VATHGKSTKEKQTMNRIVEQFAGRRGSSGGVGRAQQGPPLISGPAPAPEEVLHPAVVETFTKYSQALEAATTLRAELARVEDHYREEVRQLRADLEVERRHVLELRHTLNGERAQLEDYRRYAVTIRTLMTQIANTAVHANEVAMSIPKLQHDQEEAVLRAVAEAVDPQHDDDDQAATPA